MKTKTLFALSGGVDSSTAAALTLADMPPGHIRDPGHEAVAVTLGLWGGERESTSCSTSDTTAARHVAAQLGVQHTYIDWTEDFSVDVVGKFISYAKEGKTMNPCIACNKTFKADRMFAWAQTNGFSRVVTGHYARVAHTPDGPRIARAVNVEKDQSYVLCGFTPEQIARLHLPLGELTKPQVRDHARRFNLDVADKPESMGLCFSPQKVLATAALGNVRIVDSATGQQLGEVPVGIAAVGQRKGLGVGGNATAKYVVDIRSDAVIMGEKEELRSPATPITNWVWVGGTQPHGPTHLQTSAHGKAAPGRYTHDAIIWDEPHTRVAPGQIVVAYTTYNINGENIECVTGWGEAN